MKREDVEKTITGFGFQGYAVENHDENKVIYTFPRPTGYGNLIINDLELFVNNWGYLKIEVDDFGIVARLYSDLFTYVGCVVLSFEDLDCFKLKKGF